VDEAIERKLRHREQRAGVAISAIILILGLSIIIAAIDDFTRGAESNEQLQLVVGLSFWSIILFSILTCLKFRYAVRLDSESLYKDGICSLIGTIMSCGLFVNTLVIGQAEEAWWIDPVVALLAGIFAIIYGTQSVWRASKQGLPICSCAWWLGKKQGHEDEDIELPPAGGGEGENEII